MNMEIPPPEQLPSTWGGRWKKKGSLFCELNCLKDKWSG